MRAIYILLLLIPTMVTAQNEWSLSDCIHYALNHHPDISIKKEEVIIGKQNYLEAIGSLLPTIESQVGAALSYGNSRDYATQAMTSNNTFSNQYNLSARLMIFDGLSSINRLKMNRINRTKSINQLQNTKDLLSYEVVEAYLNVAYYKETQKLAKQQLKASSEDLHKNERMKELGMISLVDLTEARAKMAEDKYFLTQQNNLVKLATILLKEKLNFPLNEDLQVKSIKDNYEVAKTLESSSTVFESALHYLPSALISENEVNAQRMSYRSAKGAWFPQISMSVGMSTNYFKYLNNKNGNESRSWSTQLKDNKGEYIQFNLSIPIFTGFKRSSSIRRAKAYFTIARHEQDNMHTKIYQDIEQTIANVNGQVDDYEQAIEQEEAMWAAHQANTKKHQEGLIDPIQLSMSANRLLQAKVARTKSYHTYVLQLKLYQYYKGIPYTAEN